MEDNHAPGSAKVLLIEDNRVVRGVLAEMLSGAGLDVEELPDGERLFEREPPIAPPHIIITDVDLGGSSHDGLEVAQQARRFWPNVGVVFITAQPSRLNGQPTGKRDHFLVKPFRSAQLVGAVTSLLRVPSTHAPR